MIRNLIRCAALAATVGLGGCNLAIDNPGAGDTKKVLGTPNDAEALISTYYKRWSSGVYGSTINVEGMANVMSLMNYSSLANSCQNARWPFVNAANGNSPGNVCADEQSRLYQFMGEVNRVASNFLEQMDSGALNLGPTAPATDARNLRARSWAEFLRGISLGYTAMLHDSSSIISPSMSKAVADCAPDASGICVGALRNYPVVMDSALAALQRSVGYATTTGITGTDGFPIPNTWLPSPTTWTAPEFVRLVRSYQARFRANVARTPTERAAVNWALVVADAQAGITSDHLVTTSTTAGPGNSWRQQYNSFTTWHQMPPFFIGMADNSGSYSAWIAQPVSDRGAGNTGFFMTTPDLRFPQGATRAAQIADFALTSCETAATPCKRYFVNRVAAADQFSGAGWGWSNYDFARFRSWHIAGDGGSARNGNTPFFTIAELDLLQAEGLYRIGGSDATVANLINKTRTAPMSGTPLVARGGGLPPVTAANRTVALAGADCVPKVPNTSSVVSCGDLWEALKYEKRIETAYTHFVPWFLDGRGWGDLPKDTPLFWPVPYQDLQARGRPLSALYGTGPGSGNAPNSSAAGSSYGW